MERRREMDAAGRASARIPLIRTACPLLIVACCILSAFASNPQADCSVDQIKHLSAQQRWQEVVEFAPCVTPPSADVQFDYGTALAKLERWADASNAFRAGQRLAPTDKRFPQELAGIAFKQKKYAEAVQNLRDALRLDPGDNYTNDFLATVYFLQGNLEAALKYWNRVQKPVIANVSETPKPKVNPALLDRAFAFAFSPATVLRLPDLLTTQERIDGLDIFPKYRFDLQAREDGRFDLEFINRERNGFGNGTLESLFLVFGGLPFQTIYPEYFNLKHSAINITSLFRWDAEKRRVLASLSGPVQRNPKWRYDIQLDLRSENWDIRNSFTGPAPLLGSLNLRRESLGASFTAFESGRWKWSAGAELSHRDFRSVVPGVALTSCLLAKGYELKQLARLDADLWRIPEHRIDLSGALSSHLARLYSQPGHTFDKLQGSLQLHWLPKPEGDDYEVQHQLRAGRTLGDLPFDELFVLGVERDNDLWMRAHIGTRNGRKGSAALGRNYFLSNLQIDKNVYEKGLLTLKLGPFLDTGKISDSFPGLGSHKWLWDTGAQLTVKAFGVGVVFCYGKDLRSGNNAIYVSMQR